MATTIGQGNQDFSYDKKKVSANVNQQVENIKNEGKKIAGSADEVAAFSKLAEELSANGANKHEQNMVKGLIIEYQAKVEQEETQAKQKKQKAEVTPAAREAVKNLKKMIPNKKELDEPEARMLLDLIKNTRGDYNSADIEYFKQELIKAGFGKLLNELEDKGNMEPAEPTEPTPPIESELAEPAEQQKSVEPMKPIESTEPQKPTEPMNPVEPTKPAEPQKPTEPMNPVEPTKPTEPRKPTEPMNPVEPTKPAEHKTSEGGLRFKVEDVPNRAHLIVEASEVWYGTDEEIFIDNVTIGQNRYKDGSGVADKYLHGRQPLNAAEAKAIDKELRNMTGKGLLQYMSEEFTIGGGGGDDQFITQLYRQYITYGLKQD